MKLRGRTPVFAPRRWSADTRSPSLDSRAARDISQLGERTTNLEIARALSYLHQRPHEPWTVDSLAREVGQSRATFNRRFVSLIGEPPASYLGRWRMSLAAHLLRHSELSLEDVAARVGYESAVPGR